MEEKPIIQVGNGMEGLGGALERALPGAAREVKAGAIPATTPSGRSLLTVPDARLLREAEPVVEIDSYVREVVADLQWFLGHPSRNGTSTSYCIGMAAPQIGENIRVFVVRLQGIDWVAINPVPSKRQGSRLSQESCESIPGRSFVVKRPVLFKLSALDINGERRGYKGRDLMAAVLEHEYEHLHGVLIDQEKRLLDGDRI